MNSQPRFSPNSRALSCVDALYESAESSSSSFWEAAFSWQPEQVSPGRSSWKLPPELLQFFGGVVMIAAFLCLDRL